jgi:hypothetical protein
MLPSDCRIWCRGQRRIIWRIVGILAERFSIRHIDQNSAIVYGCLHFPVNVTAVVTYPVYDLIPCRRDWAENQYSSRVCVDVPSNSVRTAKFAFISWRALGPTS